MCLNDRHRTGGFLVLNTGGGVWGGQKVGREDPAEGGKTGLSWKIFLKMREASKY